MLISRRCRELIRCLPALLFDKNRPEDAAGEPHSITHSPEALRYALMSRFTAESELPVREEHRFRFRNRSSDSFFDSKTRLYPVGKGKSNRKEKQWHRSNSKTL